MSDPAPAIPIGLYKSVIAALFGAVILTVLVGVALAATDPRSEWPWDIFRSLALVSLLLAVATAAGGVMRRGRRVPLVLMSLILAGAGSAIILVLLWARDLTHMLIAAKLFGPVGLVLVILGIALAYGEKLAFMRSRAGLVEAMRVLMPVSLWSGTAMIVGALCLMPVYSVMLELSRTDLDQDFMRIGASLLILGVALVHTGVFTLMRPRTRLIWWLQVITSVCLLLGALLLVSRLWLVDWLVETGWPPTLPAWALIILSLTLSLLLLAAAIGTIVVPITVLTASDRRAAAVETVASRLRITLACPKCGGRQELGTGNVRCTLCGARLFIEIEEPRCECGYLLHMLPGESCPECGRAIPERQRWRENRGRVSSS